MAESTKSTTKSLMSEHGIFVSFSVASTCEGTGAPHPGKVRHYAPLNLLRCHTHSQPGGWGAVSGDRKGDSFFRILIPRQHWRG
jgi:hypothetical protein